MCDPKQRVETVETLYMIQGHIPGRGKMQHKLLLELLGNSVNSQTRTPSPPASRKMFAQLSRKVAGAGLRFVL